MIQISPDDNSINNNNHAIVITIPIVVVSILFVVALILAWKNYRTSLLKKDTANKKEEKKNLAWAEFRATCLHKMDHEHK